MVTAADMVNQDSPKQKTHKSESHWEFFIFSDLHCLLDEKVTIKK